MCRVKINFPELAMHEYSAEVPFGSTVQDLYDHLIDWKLLSVESKEVTYLTSNGLCVNNNDRVIPKNSYFIHLRLRGGKGGFGSMLRALGSQIEKTTNNEACRDLSGRRMRDVNNEKKMMDWVKKKAEKDRQKEKEKIEKLERQLQRPKHFFNDPEYEKKLDETIDSVEDALKTGLKAANKRVVKDNKPSNQPLPKKSKLWLGDDDLSDSSDSDSDHETKVSIPTTSKNEEEPCTSTASHSPEQSTSSDTAEENEQTNNDVKNILNVAHCA